MGTIADLIIKVRADTLGAERDIKSLSGKVSGGFRKALIPATVALGALGAAAKVGFDELKEGQNVAAQTNAVLKSTGGVAHVTAGHVDELATSLLKKSGVDDEVIKSGENVLLTFTGIRNEVGKGNDVFNQATQAALDLSVGLGRDMTSSAKLVGKALNDPIRGITQLRRVGIQFTADQEKQIKTLVKTGHTMEAQKIVLDGLSSRFEGRAAAAAGTFTGKMNIAKEEAKNFAATILQGAMPSLEGFASGMGKATAFAQDHTTAVKIVVGVIAGLSATIIAVNIALKLYAAAQAVVRLATAAWTAAQWLLNAALTANPIGIVIVALVALGAALAVAWAKSETFRNIVTGAWNAVKNTTLTVFNSIKDFFSAYWPLLLAIVGGPVGAIAALVITKWDTIRDTTVSVWNAVKNAVLGVLNGIKTTAEAVFEALVATVRAVIKPLSSSVDNVVGIFGRIKGVLDAIISAASSAWDWIQKVSSVGGILDGIKGMIPGFAGGVRNFGGGLAVVGESGPELVNLPRGADVFSNGQSRSMMGGRHVSVTIQGATAAPMDEQRLAEVLRRAELLAV